MNLKEFINESSELDKYRNLSQNFMKTLFPKIEDAVSIGGKFDIAEIIFDEAIRLAGKDKLVPRRLNFPKKEKEDIHAVIHGIGPTDEFSVEMAEYFRKAISANKLKEWRNDLTDAMAKTLRRIIQEIEWQRENRTKKYIGRHAGIDMYQYGDAPDVAREN